MTDKIEDKPLDGPETIQVSAQVLDIDDLVFDAENTRLHTKQNYEIIDQSLDLTGPWRSIAIDENNRINAGNGVTERAKKRGIKRVLVIEGDDETLVAVRRKDIPDDDKAISAMLDNRSGETAQWDQGKLAALTMSSPQAFKAVSRAWSETEAARLATLLVAKKQQDEGEQGLTEGDTEPDLIPVNGDETESKADRALGKWQVEPGQLWSLGDHRIYCGDARDPLCYRRLSIDPYKVQKYSGILTSPPYANQRDDEYGGIDPDQYVNWWCSGVETHLKEHLADDGSFFLNLKEHSEDGTRHLYVRELVIEMVKRLHWSFIDELVWRRHSIPGTYMNKFKNCWEPVFHFGLTPRVKFRPRNVLQDYKQDPDELTDYTQAGRKRPKSHSGLEMGGRISYDREGALPENLIEIYGSPGKSGHPASFPWQLPHFFLRAYSDPGDIWLDPFVGGGSTILAGEHSRRPVHGIEVKPAHVAIALEVWSQLTNKTPVLVN